MSESDGRGTAQDTSRGFEIRGGRWEPHDKVSVQPRCTANHKVGHV